MTDACLDKRTDAMLSRSIKPRRCKVKTCREKFTPLVHWQDWCAEDCAVILAVERVERNRLKDERAREKRERAEWKARKEKIKNRRDHESDTQKAFNAYIRARDHGLPCISCGTTANVQYAAGHYRTTAAAPHLRFDEKNVHLQCNRNCNMAKSGNVAMYRLGLIVRYGIAYVEAIEADNEPRKYTIDDLKAMRADYRARLRELKRSAL